MAVVRATLGSYRELSDSELPPIFEYLEKDILPADEKQAQRLALEKVNFEVIDGVFYYKNPAIPGYCSRELETHLAEGEPWWPGHFSEKKMYSTLCTQYWWKGMQVDERQLSHLCIKALGEPSNPSYSQFQFEAPFIYGWRQCTLAATLIQRKQVCHCLYGLLYQMAQSHCHFRPDR